MGVLTYVNSLHKTDYVRPDCPPGRPIALIVRGAYGFRTRKSIARWTPSTAKREEGLSGGEALFLWVITGKKTAI